MRPVAQHLITIAGAALVWLGAIDAVAALQRQETRRNLDLDLVTGQDGQEQRLPTEERDGVPCTIIDVPAGEQVKAWANGEFNWTDARALVLRAKLGTPSQAPVQLIAFFQDVDYWWFQKLLRNKLAGDADSGWTEITVPLVPEPTDAGTKYAWQSIGHAKPYDRNALRKARRVGLIVIPADTRGRDDGPVRVLLAGAHLLVDAEQPMDPPCICDLVAPPTVRKYERFEVAFRLDRVYPNPFDPDVIDVRAQITTPSGRTVDVLGFWYQDYRRRIIGQREELVPVGEPSWRVRFAPSEVGLHTMTITARDAGGERTTKPRRFDVLDRPSDGFLRVSKADYHYFEFESGRPWWGIGINLHCHYDYRYQTKVRNNERIIEIDRYTLFYDDRLRKCAENGINWTELWFASWGFEIEWRGDWRGWAGTGHYSLEHAWRLDRVLEQCRQYGIYANVDLTCHGVYRKADNESATFGDDEFQHHPYYRRNGGWLHDGSQILTDQRAHQAMRKRLRYIVARYADSTNVACWTMISEADLVLRDNDDAVRPWALAMADMVKAMDPYGHPTTNHYSNNYKAVDPILARDRRMDLVAGDAYRGGEPGRSIDGTRCSLYYEPMPGHLVRAARHFDSFRKPAIITECGGQWFAGPKPLLIADTHAFAWAGWMTKLAAMPMTWWEDFVDELDLYHHFAAIARYTAGEDKRDRNLQTKHLDAVNAAGEPIAHLRTLALANSTGGYAWVYDAKYYEFGVSAQFGYYAHTQANTVYHLERKGEPRRFDNAVAVITDLEDGHYDVEIWDCYAGEVIDRTQLRAQRGCLAVPLPAFTRDIALKFAKRR